MIGRKDLNAQPYLGEIANRDLDHIENDPVEVEKDASAKAEQQYDGYRTRGVSPAASAEVT